MTGYNQKSYYINLQYKKATINKKGFKMMDATVRASVDSDLKQEAEAI